jgi:lipopolysaccharide transport system ATP-binding protein
MHPLRASSGVPLEGLDSTEEFWALKDVSFEVQQGDRIGIIGRNGAGKSTLLKILSRITEPTSGRALIKGRVASLLEVGTGFHPELTGQENIFLNGAILGMTKAEIRRKFDEIVAFAEIEKFLDTPVKRYSSGMYVRLAFAVAAHLEPEILIVDEVLAVGDAQFQKKCLGKMEEVSAKEGRTVLFVSHSLPAVNTLCTSCILLNSGVVSCVGDPSHVFGKYSNIHAEDRCQDNFSVNIFDNVRIVGSNRKTTDIVYDTDSAYVLIRMTINNNVGLNCGITLFNSENVPLISSCLLDSHAVIDQGVVEYQLEIPVSILPSGYYRVEGALWTNSLLYDKSECLTTFTLVRTDSTLEKRGTKSRGMLLFPGRWERNCFLERDGLLE